VANIDKSIYRLVSRYRAVIGKNNTDYLAYRK